MIDKNPGYPAESKAMVAASSMSLTGVGPWASELAVLLGKILVQHGHIESEPDSLYTLLTAARSAVRESVPFVAGVQEGGSSTELYLQLFDNEKQVNRWRRSCAKSAYNTSTTSVQVPRSLAAHPAFHQVVEALLKASLKTEVV